MNNSCNYSTEKIAATQIDWSLKLISSCYPKNYRGKQFWNFEWHRMNIIPHENGISNSFKTALLCPHQKILGIRSYSPHEVQIIFHSNYTPNEYQNQCEINGSNFAKRKENTNVTMFWICEKVWRLQHPPQRVKSCILEFDLKYVVLKNTNQIVLPILYLAVKYIFLTKTTTNQIQTADNTYTFFRLFGVDFNLP